ncbi:unnamed protein product [Lactuca virosa]|uniref:Uncharacterized protein n=1 Tax=Lactuca virosa TaxID=75947 RepID=A0AAU9NAS9_9ASTR|nr:unnamed protein product [Lactuca virosa]
MHLTNRVDHEKRDMEIDDLQTPDQVVDEMEVTVSDGKREMYEIYLEHLSNESTEEMEIYLSIMSDVVGGYENAIQVLVGNKHDMNNCFLVNLTRSYNEEEGRQMRSFWK